MTDSSSQLKVLSSSAPQSQGGSPTETNASSRISPIPLVASPRSHIWRTRTRTLLVASGALVAVVAAGFVWASMAKVVITATAQGKVAPLGRVQVVAHAEGGAVRALNVQVGQHVKAGDVLIELEATTARADLTQLDNELAAHEAAIRRLEAEQAEKTPDFTGISPVLAQSETNLFTARKAHYDAEVKAAQAERSGAQAGINAAAAGVRLLQERLDSRKKLLATGDASRFSVIEDEARLAELAGRQATSQAGEQNAAANVSALAQARAEEIAKSLVDHHNQETELSKARPKILSRLENLSVVAPVDGTVKSVSVTGPGAVLKPGEALAEIVPDGGERLIVARLPAAEIGYVHSGQAARVTLMPPDMHFRPVTGTVQMLAPDSAADERTGQLTYMVEIKTDSNRFTSKEDQAIYPLLDGVPVAVGIITGQRSVLGLVAGPLFAELRETVGER